MSIVLVILLTSVLAAAGAVFCFALRGARKRMLLSYSQGVESEMPGGTGISVLCSGVHGAKQIESLLTIEFARYEVVVVLDSLRYPAEFDAIASRYHMINVDFTPMGDFPSSGVRGVLRSRQRCFRRLVLIDRRSVVPEGYFDAAGDFDAAADASSYEYVLPVREGQHLLIDSVRRLIAELGEEPDGTIDAIRACLGEPAVLLNRGLAAYAGGFTHKPARVALCRRCRLLWEPIVVSHAPRTVDRRLRAAAATALAALVAGSLAAGWWAVAAVALTAAIVWCVSVCMSMAFGCIADELQEERWRLGKISVKNFTIS